MPNEIKPTKKAETPVNRDDLLPVPAGTDKADLIEKAVNEQDGYTLVPQSKVEGNDKVEAAQPEVLYRGYVVCKAK